MNSEANVSERTSRAVQINGMAVRLIFAPEGNAEAITVVKDILKGAYLRSRNAQ